MELNEYLREKDGHFVLTQKDIQEFLGVNIEDKVSSDAFTNENKLIERLLEKVSHQTYGYLYQFNDSDTIDLIIQKSDTAKRVLKHAMEEQFLYIWENGDMIDSEKPFSRELEFAFNTIIPETGKTLTYMGSYYGLYRLVET